MAVFPIHSPESFLERLELFLEIRFFYLIFVELSPVGKGSLNVFLLDLIMIEVTFQRDELFELMWLPLGKDAPKSWPSFTFLLFLIHFLFV